MPTILIVDDNPAVATALDTPRNRKDIPDADFATWVKPEELARVMMFLITNEAKSLSGTNLLAGA